jgi:hypothetical protein
VSKYEHRNHYLEDVLGSSLHADGGSEKLKKLKVMQQVEVAAVGVGNKLGGVNAKTST